jgi:ectoine hydroxylase-related dioxygenase (phytanoyl-CoA dioxygenase family)
MDDVTPEMGPVFYYPKSHRLGSLGRATSKDSRTKVEVNGPVPLGTADRFLYGGDTLEKPISFTLEAGEAVIHDGLTIHGSDGNNSDRVRRGWGSVYVPSETQYTGMPRAETDGLGLTPFGTFDHPKFPIVAY